MKFNSLKGATPSISKTINRFAPLQYDGEERPKDSFETRSQKITAESIFAKFKDQYCTDAVNRGLNGKKPGLNITY